MTIMGTRLSSVSSTLCTYKLQHRGTIEESIMGVRVGLKNQSR